MLLYCSGRFGTLKEILKKLTKVKPARLKLWAFFIYNYMGAIEYNGYLITKEAKIFEICSNIEIEPTIHKTGKLYYLLDGVKT